MSRRNEALKFVAWSVLFAVAGGITLPLLLVIAATVTTKIDYFLYVLAISATLALLGVASGVGLGIIIGFLSGLIYILFYRQLRTAYGLSLRIAALFSFMSSLLLYPFWLNWIDRHTTLFQFNFG